MERAAPWLGGLLLLAVLLAASVVVALTNDASTPIGPVGTEEIATDLLPRADTLARSPSGGTDSATGADTGVRPTCVADDGCLIWTVEHPGRGPVWRDVSVDGDLLVLTDRLGVTAIDIDDGVTRWRIEADPTAETGARGHAVSDTLVVLIERDGVLRAYDRSTGALAWISPLPAALRVSHAVDHGDVVVVVADAVAGSAGAVRLLAGFDAATGERRWLRRASAAAATAQGPVVFDGPATLRGLDPANGLVRWEAQVEGPLGSVVGVGASAIYVGWEQTVVVEAATGRTITTTGPPPSLTASRHAEAIVLLGDERLEFVTGSGSMWSVAPPTDACCATVLDGNVVVVDVDGARTVLDGRDGSVLERRDGRGDGVFVGPAWLVATDGEARPGRQAEADPEVVAMQVFDARGGRGVATTPAGIAIAGLPDGVVIAGEGWLSRIRTD